MLNRFIFSVQDFDSASLSMLASVIHKFSQIGEYHCAICRGTEVVGRFSIDVTQRDTGVDCCLGQQQTQVNIDLKALEMSSTQHFESQAVNRFQIVEGGYAVFHVSNGVGGYSVEVDKIGHETQAIKVFDSKELKEDDLYAATILRPGTYCITNQTTKAQAELAVAYPERGKIPKQPQAIHIQCSKDAFMPNRIQINPTEPLVFHFQIPSRIKIELTKPEDRPKPTPTQQTTTQATTAAQEQRAKKIRRQLKINV